jgi:hypothetical protein
MFRKFMHVALAALAHLAILLSAHGLAEKVGHEIVSLVRDEWAVGVATLALGDE